MTPTDTSLAPAPLSPEALARVRSAAAAELQAHPVAPSWRKAASRLAMTVGVITLVGTAVVSILNWPPSALFAGRLPAIIVLAVAQIVGLVAAIAPGRSKLGPLSWALAISGVLVVLATRSADGTSTSGLPGWVCSASHVTAGVLPLLLVVRALRDAAFDWRRAVTAGVALGVSAPLWGEVTCERGLGHVVTHHIGALLVLAIVVLVSARQQRPRSFAP